MHVDLSTVKKRPIVDVLVGLMCSAAHRLIIASASGRIFSVVESSESKSNLHKASSCLQRSDDRVLSQRSQSVDYITTCR